MLAACGSSAVDDRPIDSSSGAGTSATGSGGHGGASGTGGNLTPIPADPMQLGCGAETCSVPGQFCCHASVVPPGVDHCVDDKSDCKAPNRACDEAADCPAGQICCTGAAVLPKEAVVDGFAGTLCVDANSPANCLPEPGVGKSSVPACKKDDDCTADSCVLESCHGYPLMTCGGSQDCS